MTDGINKESSGQSTDLTCLRTKESLIADVWKQNDCRGRTKSKYPGGGGGGYSWEFLVGACRPVLQILTRFQTKKVIFYTCFQTKPLKSTPVFRPGL